jgi:translation initiation factor IF-2
VIELAKASHIPLIIAINKIDRPEADVKATMLDLASHDLLPEEMGGNQICVPISAKERINLDIL